MKNSGVSTLALALRAIHAACDDAGISFKDLDGVATHRVGDSVQGAVVLNALGMTDPKFYVDQFGGGSASHTVVGQAAMAVATGVADYVVGWLAINPPRLASTSGKARPDRQKALALGHLRHRFSGDSECGDRADRYRLAARVRQRSARFQ